MLYIMPDFPFQFNFIQNLNEKTSLGNFPCGWNHENVQDFQNLKYYFPNLLNKNVHLYYQKSLFFVFKLNNWDNFCDSSGAKSVHVCRFSIYPAKCFNLVFDCGQFTDQLEGSFMKLLYS